MLISRLAFSQDEPAVALQRYLVVTNFMTLPGHGDVQWRCLAQPGGSGGRAALPSAARAARQALAAAGAAVWARRTAVTSWDVIEAVELRQAVSDALHMGLQAELGLLQVHLAWGRPPIGRYLAAALRGLEDDWPPSRLGMRLVRRRDYRLSNASEIETVRGAPLRPAARLSEGTGSSLPYPCASAPHRGRALLSPL